MIGTDLGRHRLGGQLLEASFRVPASFAPAQDLIACSAGSVNRAHFVRLCAAAIGIAWGEGPQTPPKYPSELADPVAYGGRMLDWLYARKVPQARVVRLGNELMMALFATLPSEPEVTEAEDFSAPVAPSTSGVSVSIGTGDGSPGGVQDSPPLSA